MFVLAGVGCRVGDVVAARAAVADGAVAVSAAAIATPLLLPMRSPLCVALWSADVVARRHRWSCCRTFAAKPEGFRFQRKR